MITPKKVRPFRFDTERAIFLYALFLRYWIFLSVAVQ